VANALVALDFNLTANIARYFTAKVTFDFVIGFDEFTKLCQFWLLKIFDAGIWANAGRSECCVRAGQTNPEDVRECNLYSLLAREIDTN
jgi:hypothetical protein